MTTLRARAAWLLEFDLSAVAPAAARVRTVYGRDQLPTTDPRLGADERDLRTWAEQAQVADDSLELECPGAPSPAEGGQGRQRRAGANLVAPRP